MVYQSQTLGDVPARRLSPEWGRHETMCQQKHWAPKEVDWGVPHRLEKGMSVNEDARPRRGWIVISHIGWRGERSIFYKDVETSP